ncbi:hypothetical protein [Paraburkholderia sp. BL9I2N2]|uniref:hypothetical protein n=1 Tax=Paraburkholderia sp. BL9I2N2 TaxID=1938809 RepID=UPI00104C3E4F|nr:hypothetical protein [Paraburkholderia sp. BL9I2N2]
MIGWKSNRYALRSDPPIRMLLAVADAAFELSQGIGVSRDDIYDPPERPTADAPLVGRRRPEQCRDDDQITFSRAFAANSAVTGGLLARLTEWYGFPRPNAAKIVTAIQARIESVVAKTASPSEAMQGMVSDVQALLPRTTK